MICKRCGKGMELRPNKKFWHCWFCGYEEKVLTTYPEDEAKFLDIDKILENSEVGENENRKRRT